MAYNAYVAVFIDSGIYVRRCARAVYDCQRMGQHISLYVMAHNCDKYYRSIRKNIETAVIAGRIAIRAVKAPYFLALCVKTHDYEVVIGVALHVHRTGENGFVGISGSIAGVAAEPIQ